MPASNFRLKAGSHERINSQALKAEATQAR